MVKKTSLPEPAGRVTPPCRHFCPVCGDPIHAVEHVKEALDNVKEQLTLEMIATALSEAKGILQARGGDLGSPSHSQGIDGTDNGGDIDETTSEEYNDEQQGE